MTGKKLSKNRAFAIGLIVGMILGVIFGKLLFGLLGGLAFGFVLRVFLGNEERDNDT